jgi:hypothetical protein
MQSHRGIHVTHGTVPTDPREAGTILRWGAVIALLLMLATLGWAVRRSEHLGPEATTVTAATWARAHPADWSWVQAHWTVVAAARGHVGDPAWMASHLTGSEAAWMGRHAASMSWMVANWDDMAAMHRSMQTVGMMGGP